MCHNVSIYKLLSFFNVRIAFKIAIIVTPTSANTAIHIVANPKPANIRTVNLKKKYILSSRIIRKKNENKLKLRLSPKIDINFISI